jgi:hypothetical protein
MKTTFISPIILSDDGVLTIFFLHTVECILLYARCMLWIQYWPGTNARQRGDWSDNEFISLDKKSTLSVPVRVFHLLLRAVPWLMSVLRPCRCCVFVFSLLPAHAQFWNYQVLACVHSVLLNFCMPPSCCRNTHCSGTQRPHRPHE